MLYMLSCMYYLLVVPYRHSALALIFCVCRHERALIEQYFHMGFPCTSMVRFMATYHGVTLSTRSLEHRLL
jgi:hypothetical protein